MVALTQPFNALQYDPEMGGSALPLGLKQPVRALESLLKGARENNNNGFLEFTVEILDGPNKGQTGALRFNLYNSNGDAARIAHNQLAAMAMCCGVPHFQDSAQLHNMPFMIDVTPQKVKVGQEDKGYTEVSAYYNIQGQKPLKGGGFSAPATGGGQQQQQQSNFAANQPNGNQQQQQAPQNSGGNAGWNGGNGQQDPNQGQQQQQQQFNQNQQGNNGGGNFDQSQQQQNQQQQQQQQAPATNANAGWNGGGNTAGNTGNASGGAPWNK